VCGNFLANVVWAFSHPEPPASMENAIFLITEFPPEQLVSTPVPVCIPGVDSRAIRPGEVRTSGIYQRHKTHRPPTLRIDPPALPQAAQPWQAPPAPAFPANIMPKQRDDPQKPKNSPLNL
jgi:hypothetical protein